MSDSTAGMVILSCFRPEDAPLPPPQIQLPQLPSLQRETRRAAYLRRAKLPRRRRFPTPKAATEIPEFSWMPRPARSRFNPLFRFSYIDKVDSTDLYFL